MMLDGRPALDVFYEDIGERLARDPSRIGGYIHAALPIEDSDRADYLVRNLIGIDPMRRWLAVGAQIASGDRVMFVRRDPANLDRMLTHLARRLDGPPSGALYFSCVARGEHMFGETGAELAMIRRTIGPVPLLGSLAAARFATAAFTDIRECWRSSAEGWQQPRHSAVPWPCPGPGPPSAGPREK
jgi:hypothetical protein